MPMYSFKCRKCGRTDLKWMKMKDAIPAGDALASPCPYCQHDMCIRQVDHPNTPLTEFAEPIVMHSVGCNSMDEIREIQTKCPDVQISDDPRHPDFGVPIAKNRQQKLQVLKAVGFAERN